MKQIKILIADDHSILQHGLSSSLEMEKDIQVVGRADSGYLAIEMADRLNPDLVIMDVGMPELNGMEATKQILKKFPDIKVMGLSMHMEKVYVTGMINAGASGYIIKSCSFKELLSAIHTIMSGQTYFCSEVEHFIEDGVDIVSDNPLSVFNVLSKREREVLQLIAEGHKSRMIAKKLNISVKTVDIHRNNIKSKLDIHSIAELTKFAISKGLTSPVI